MVHRTIPCSFKTENRNPCLWFVLPIWSFLGLGLNVMLVCYTRMERSFILFVLFRYSEWVNKRYCYWRLNLSTELTNHVVVHSLSFTHLYIWLSVYIFRFVLYFRYILHCGNLTGICLYMFFALCANQYHVSISRPTTCSNCSTDH